MEQIEQGIAGLFYLTDSENRTIFLAATSEQEAKQWAILARQGRDIPRHTLHDYQRGGQLLIPDPKGMTPEQRQETIDRMQDHLRERFAS